MSYFQRYSIFTLRNKIKISFLGSDFIVYLN